MESSFGPVPFLSSLLSSKALRVLHKQDFHVIHSENYSVCFLQISLLGIVHVQIWTVDVIHGSRERAKFWQAFVPTCLIENLQAEED